MKKLKFNFKASTPVTDAELASLRPHVLKMCRLARLAQAEAQELFEAHENLYQSEFEEYIEAHPPSPQAISRLVDIALAADDPEKPRLLGKKKFEKLYGSARKEVIAEWEKYQDSAKYKSKSHFAQLQAKKLTTSIGGAISASTINRWLPKNKK